MTERPILFSAPMVRAILAGKKTQTRRVVRWPSWTGFVEPGASFEINPAGEVCWAAAPHGVVGTLPRPCDSGDRLWVRETAIIAPPHWNDGTGANTRDWEGVPRLVQYLASDPCRDAADDYRLKATPSIHLPRWASRITLEVTAVRVERLQDISEEDAIAEGVDSFSGEYEGEPIEIPASHRFSMLWDQMNGDRAPWSSNPWVWVVEFRRVEAGA